jgi:DNA-binding NtrC family response regulator
MNIMLQVTNCSMPPWDAGDSPDSEEARGVQEGQGDPARSPRQRNANCKGRILLVDDDPSVRETLAELLDDVGFCTLQAGDVLEAMVILRQDPAIDALVTDLTMPGDDGIALIRQAREIKGDLPAILLTGYAEHVTSVSTIAGGNFHVLRKPVESDHLIEQLLLLAGRSSP